MPSCIIGEVIDVGIGFVFCVVLRGASGGGGMWVLPFWWLS